MKLKQIIWVCTLPLLLSGCLSQSQVQAKYSKSQNICRAQTATLFSRIGSGPTSGAEGQSAIASRFSDCMNKAGWRVGPPKGTQTAQNQYPPSGAPSTNPSASTGARQVPVENRQGGMQPAPAPASQTAQNQYPPSGAPSTNPSAAAAKPVAANMSTPPDPSPLRIAQPSVAAPALNLAQPARPPVVPPAPFGSPGAARQF
jgi:hypothetical protein